MIEDEFKAACRDVERGFKKALARRLLHHPALAAHLGGEPKTTLLHLAARHGRSEMVAMLLQHGARPNDTNHIGSTPLHSAAEANDREAIDALLAADADIAVRDSMDHTVLDCLFLFPYRTKEERKRGAALFFHLLEKGAVIANNRRLMTLAASGGVNGVVEYLLQGTGESGGPKEKRSEPAYRSLSSRRYSTSPLREAIFSKKASTVRTLLKHGAADTNDGEEGRDALVHALKYANLEMVRLLCEYGVSTDPRYYFPPSAFPLPDVSIEQMAWELLGTEEVEPIDGLLFPQPTKKEMVEALIVELNKYTPEQRRLISLAPFDFCGGFIEKMLLEYVRNLDIRRPGKRR